MEIIRLKITDSTNNEAKRRIDDGRIAGPALITADMQTAGRGRQGKSFFSPEGTGIYMTVVVPVNGAITSQVNMTTRVAVITTRKLEEYFNTVLQIKWVNDIYFNNRKCAGILCEAVNDYDRGIMRYAIVGIGINIVTDNWPGDLKEIAGSLLEAGEEAKSGRHIRDEYDDMVRELAEELISELADPQDVSYMQYYRQHSMVIGKEISFTENGRIYYGRATSIDDFGGLVVEIRDEITGETLQRTLNSGEITLRLKNSN